MHYLRLLSQKNLCEWLTNRGVGRVNDNQGRAKAGYETALTVGGSTVSDSRDRVQE